MSKKRQLYRVRREKSAHYGDRYQHLNVEITVEDGYNKLNLAVKWQSHWDQSDEAYRDWYCPHVGLGSEGITSPWQLKEFGRVCRVLMGTDQMLGSPQQIVDRLEAKRFQLGVYDARVSELVAVKDLEDLAKNKYMGKRSNSGSYIASVVAYDAQEAEKLLYRAILEYSQHALDEWVLNGKIVDEMPCEGPSEELLHPSLEANPEEVTV